MPPRRARRARVRRRNPAPRSRRRRSVRADRATALDDPRSRLYAPHEQFPDLAAGETELRGGWLDLGSHLVRDHVCARIEWLVTERLQLRGAADDGRVTLYRDPADGRLWELQRTSGTESIIGAPLLLALISHDDAVARYGPAAG